MQGIASIISSKRLAPVCVFMLSFSFISNIAASKFFCGLFFQAGYVVLIGYAVHLSIQVEPVDLGSSLDVGPRVILVLVGFILVSRKVAMAQEATDQEFFRCGKLEFSRILFLERFQQVRPSQHSIVGHEARNHRCMLL